MSEKERNKLKIFGWAVGSCTGWDQVDDFNLVFYDFIAADGFDMPKHDLNVDYINGKFLNYDNEDGSIILEKDFLTIMNGFVARHTVKNGHSKE